MNPGPNPYPCPCPNQVLPEVHTKLSYLDAKCGFITCAKASNAADEQLGFDDYVMALALCGHMKYEEVEGMSLAQRVAGVCANLLGEKDEQAVISEAIVPKIERFDPSKAKAEEAMLSEEDHKSFLTFWARMDLSHVHGFPLWEQQVFLTLHKSFHEVKAVFRQYSRTGFSLQQTELVNLALDCGLVTSTFPMARVQGVFTRADQTDDGKHGDNALELHEFMEALVQLSFSRANPRHGEAGREHEAAQPLPGCLEAMLQKNLMKKAKRDGLAKVRVMVGKDPAVLKLLEKQGSRLRHEFEASCRRAAGFKRRPPCLRTAPHRPRVASASVPGPPQVMRFSHFFGH